MSFFERPEDVYPYYDKELRRCKKCDEPILTGFVHVCRISKEVDDQVRNLSNGRHRRSCYDSDVF